MQARCLLFEFQRRRYRAEDPSVGRNDFFNRLLNVVNPAPVVEPGQEQTGRVTAEQTARFYVDSVQSEMTGQVLRAWGGLPVPSQE